MIRAEEQAKPKEVTDRTSLFDAHGIHPHQLWNAILKRSGRGANELGSPSDDKRDPRERALDVARRNIARLARVMEAGKRFTLHVERTSAAEGGSTALDGGTACSRVAFV